MTSFNPVVKKTKGKQKIDIKFIESRSHRRDTFYKRKSGLMQKVHELSVLTGNNIMLLMQSDSGNVFSYATPHMRSIFSPENESHSVKEVFKQVGIAPSQVYENQIWKSEILGSDLSIDIPPSENKPSSTSFDIPPNPSYDLPSDSYDIPSNSYDIQSSSYDIPSSNSVDIPNSSNPTLSTRNPVPNNDDNFSPFTPLFSPLRHSIDSPNNVLMSPTAMQIPMPIVHEQSDSPYQFMPMNSSHSNAPNSHLSRNMYDHNSIHNRHHYPEMNAMNTSHQFIQFTPKPLQSSSSSYRGDIVNEMPGRVTNQAYNEMNYDPMHRTAKLKESYRVPDWLN
ncbi:hypothetical protein HDV02_005511 [Globomyces sp. JEL0801]|nr:hypothetical protein HDV02_005511 [Globomyces sp. JEL0801]